MVIFTANAGLRSPSSGFTLTELLVTLSIIGILTALGVPSLSQVIQRQAAAAAGDALLSDLRLARSEAIKRGSEVQLCGASVSVVGGTPTYSCVAAPSGSNRSDWTANGWIVRDTGSGTVIKVQQRPASVGSVSATTAAFSFYPTGILKGGGFDNVLVSTSGNNTAAQQLLCVAKTGRPRLVQGASQCTAD